MIEDLPVAGSPITKIFITTSLFKEEEEDIPKSPNLQRHNSKPNRSSFLRTVRRSSSFAGLPVLLVAPGRVVCPWRLSCTPGLLAPRNQASRLCGPPEGFGRHRVRPWTSPPEQRIVGTMTKLTPQPGNACCQCWLVHLPLGLGFMRFSVLATSTVREVRLRALSLLHRSLALLGEVQVGAPLPSAPVCPRERSTSSQPERPHNSRADPGARWTSIGASARQQGPPSCMGRSCNHSHSAWGAPCAPS